MKKTPKMIESPDKIPIWKLAKDMGWGILFNALHCAKGYYFLKKRKDKRGEFIHSYQVVQILIFHQIFNEKILVAAAFHDLYEEISFDLYEEIMGGYGEDIAMLVWILSRQEGISNDIYFKRIGENIFTILIKLADRLHNLRNMAKNLGKDEFFTSQRLKIQVEETWEFIIPMVERALKIESIYNEQLREMYLEILGAIIESKIKLSLTAKA